MNELLTFGRHYVWLIPGTPVLLCILFFGIVTIALCMKDSVNATCTFRKISFSIEAHNDEKSKKAEKPKDS